MEEINPFEIIIKFIDKKNYMSNEHVIGCFFYGSYITGYNTVNSDIDLHIVLDNSDPKNLNRGNEEIDGVIIEYFEKPIGDLYKSVKVAFKNQNNAWLSILGTSLIIFDKTGEVKKLQEYTLDKFSNPLPKLEEDDAKEYVSIINNRMEKLENACNNNDIYFHHLYHLTIEKIRKFYHRLNGMPEVQTSKVFRVYTDEAYRKSFYKDDIPEEEFIRMYLDLVSDTSTDMKIKLEKIQTFYNYAKRNVYLNSKSYCFRIKSRNNRYRR